MTENEYEVALLHSDPRTLIVRYQEVIAIIVRKYIGSGLFSGDDHDEVIQSVNEALLYKADVIREQYNGTALLKTYISSIVRHICLKIHQEKKREAVLVRLDPGLPADPRSLDDRFVVDHEVEKFRLILRLHHTQFPKLCLLLKLTFRIPVSEDEMYRWFPRCDPVDVQLVVGSFGVEYGSKTDREIYRVMTPVLNRLEGKANTEDAVRKWIDYRIQEILDTLNGKPPTASHTRESLKILVEQFFSPFLTF
ncbi:MAG: hypothetical protein OEM41_06210 [Ignavibacteria bacterium]|nr:hypothetical protein [Ignavibacteria bacterium]